MQTFTENLEDSTRTLSVVSEYMRWERRADLVPIKEGKAEDERRTARMRMTWRRRLIGQHMLYTQMMGYNDERCVMQI